MKITREYSDGRPEDIAAQEKAIRIAADCIRRVRAGRATVDVKNDNRDKPNHHKNTK